jgi:hypothetical protein
MLRRLTFARAVHTPLIAVAFVVSLTPLYAQCVLDPRSSGAMVLVQSGDVSQLGDRAGSRVTIKPCGIVNQQQVIKTGPDGYAKFQVSDGSTFEVFPNTELTFRKTYGIGDLLNVWMGKVKVYIQHLPGIPNPNNVTTPTALISVRGTIFDVDVQDLDGTTFVTLDEGLVDVRHLRVASGIVRLTPGESIQVLPNMPLSPGPRSRYYMAPRHSGTAVRLSRAGQRRSSSGPAAHPPELPGPRGCKAAKARIPAIQPNRHRTGAPYWRLSTPPPPPPGGGGGVSPGGFMQRLCACRT